MPNTKADKSICEEAPVEPSTGARVGKEPTHDTKSEDNIYLTNNSKRKKTLTEVKDCEDANEPSELEKAKVQEAADRIQMNLQKDLVERLHEIEF